MKLFASDCSPLAPQPSAAEQAWLRRMAANVCVTDLAVSLGGKRDEEEPVAYCAWDGTWWAGRYVGSISFEGHSLIITPRFGLATIQSWLFEATAVVLTDSLGTLRQDDFFVAQLLACVWVRGLVDAARHGLPALRRDVAARGPTIQGRLDISASLRSLAAGSGQVVSIRSERSLDHAASNAIVAAYEVLRRWLGLRDDQWMPARAKELIPHLLSVTGARPRVPTKSELARIRYTPITAGFAPIAELSRQIANCRGLASDIDVGGETQGVLLDVAELWEMYVLSVLRKAAVPLAVMHGTRDKVANKKLLRSEVTGEGMGTLIPDAVLHDEGKIWAVVDAKYKSLHSSARAPNGPQREDLYQLAAYLARYDRSVGQSPWGVLAYPQDPARPEPSKAELSNPWRLDDRRKVIFTALPHTAPDAVSKLRSLVAQMALR